MAAHRYDSGQNDYRVWSGGVLGEVGLVVPSNARHFGGSGLFVNAGTMSKDEMGDVCACGPTMMLFGELRYRHLFGEPPGPIVKWPGRQRRNFWAAGLGTGGMQRLGSPDQISGTFAELGTELVNENVSIAVSIRHRFLIVHDDRSTEFFNLLQVVVSFGVPP